MGYFSDKSKATAASISGLLTNKVKENLGAEKSAKDQFIGDVAPFDQWYSDHRFSGEGVTSIRNKVGEVFQQFNTYSRFKVQESCKERKDLFHLGGE